MKGGFPNTNGENNRRAKLTQDQVDECRAAFLERRECSLNFYNEWAKKLGVTASAIRQVIRRRTWK